MCAANLNPLKTRDKVATRETSQNSSTCLKHSKNIQRLSKQSSLSHLLVHIQHQTLYKHIQISMGRGGVGSKQQHWRNFKLHLENFFQKCSACCHQVIRHIQRHLLPCFMSSLKGIALHTTMYFWWLASPSLSLFGVFDQEMVCRDKKTSHNFKITRHFCMYGIPSKMCSPNERFQREAIQPLLNKRPKL